MTQNTPNRSEKKRREKPNPFGERETVEFRIELLNRAILLPDLAKAVGVTLSTLRGEVSKNFPSRALRRRIEHFFGRNIWNTAKDFRHMEAVISGCGFDPYQENEKTLRAWAKENGVTHVTTGSTRGEVITAIEALAIKRKQANGN